jgi:hypothetical protein
MTLCCGESRAASASATSSKILPQVEQLLDV